MVAHQIFHVTGRIEKRCVRDTHFDAYNGQCGRPLCRFAMNNKKHHHCKLCEWPCCGVSLNIFQIFKLAFFHCVASPLLRSALPSGYFTCNCSIFYSLYMHFKICQIYSM